MYLRAQYTQEMLAEMFGIAKSTINEILFKNGQMSETEQNFTPENNNRYSFKNSTYGEIEKDFIAPQNALKGQPLWQYPQLFLMGASCPH